MKNIWRRYFAQSSSKSLKCMYYVTAGVGNAENSLQIHGGRFWPVNYRSG